MIKYIHFSNRSLLGIYLAIERIKSKFKVLDVKSKIKCGWYVGYVIVEKLHNMTYKKNRILI